jgi:hypothetical protein
MTQRIHIPENIVHNVTKVINLVVSLAGHWHVLFTLVEKYHRMLGIYVSGLNKASMLLSSSRKASTLPSTKPCTQVH